MIQPEEHGAFCSIWQNRSTGKPIFNYTNRVEDKRWELPHEWNGRENRRLEHSNEPVTIRFLENRCFTISFISNRDMYNQIAPVY